MIPDREMVRKALECIAEDRQKSCIGCEYSTFGLYPFCVHGIARDALALLKEQEEIKEQFIEAFNTIRDAYNAPANREKILLNYLARNACCCEQKLPIDSGQFADMPTMQSAT